jgi:hypothetical protein
MRQRARDTAWLESVGFTWPLMSEHGLYWWHRQIMLSWADDPARKVNFYGADGDTLRACQKLADLGLLQAVSKYVYQLADNR